MPIYSLSTFHLQLAVRALWYTAFLLHLLTTVLDKNSYDLHTSIAVGIAGFVWYRRALQRQADGNQDKHHFWVKLTPLAYSLCSGR